MSKEQTFEMMEYLTVKDTRSKVFVTVKLFIDDHGENTNDRWHTIFRIVSDVIDNIINADLDALATGIKNSGVITNIINSGYNEKDLSLNYPKNLHRITLAVTNELPLSFGKVDGAVRLDSVSASPISIDVADNAAYERIKVVAVS